MDLPKSEVVVMLVEDQISEEQVYKRKIQRVLGERVKILTARSVEEGINVFKESGGAVTLCIADLVIPLRPGEQPDPSGTKELANFISAEREVRDLPEFPLVLISGVKPPEASRAQIRGFPRIVAIEKSDFTRGRLEELCINWQILPLALVLDVFPPTFSEDLGEEEILRILKAWFISVFQEEVIGREESIKMSGITVLLEGIGRLLGNTRARVVIQNSASRNIQAELQLCLGNVEGELTKIINSAKENPSFRKAQLILAWIYCLRAELFFLRGQFLESLEFLTRTVERKIEFDKMPLGESRWEQTYEIARRICGTSSKVTGDRLWSTCLWNCARRAVQDSSEEDVIRECERHLQGLREIFSAKGRRNEAGEVEAQICRLRRRRLHGGQWLLYLLLEITSDYGNSPWRLVLITAGIVLGAAVLYMPTPESLARIVPDAFHIELKPWPYGTDSLENFFTATYFSITTFVTLGYGDITPQNSFGRLICPFEAFLGYSILGLLIAVLTDRLRPA